jgi:hypothetical protein
MLLAILIMTNAIPVGAGDVPELDLSRFTSSMSFSRYIEDLSGFRSRLYYQNGQYFFPGGPEHTQFNRGRCIGERLEDAIGLRNHLGFPFRVFKDRLHYTSDTVLEQQQISLSMEPDQVVMMKNTRLVPKNIYKGPKSPEFIEDFDEQSPYYRVITGSLWTVSGQVLIHEAPFIVPRALPWMKEPRLADFVKTFKRGDYPYLSEWGKAGQLFDGEVDPLFSGAAATDYQRVVALGMNLKDAYVSIEVDPKEYPVNARAYRSWFPGTEVAPGLFIVPLEKVLKKWPPHQYLQRVAAIIELSGGKLNDTQALGLFNEHKLLVWDEVNLKTSKGQDQGRPLVIHDLTNVASAYSQDQIFERYGIPRENFEKLETYLMQFPVKRGTINSPDISGKSNYEDGSDIAIWQKLEALHAVEISNLNGKLAEDDPNYVKTALLSSYAFYLKKFYGGKALTEAQMTPLLAEMERADVHFAITTSDPHVIAQAKLLEASKTGQEYVPEALDLSVFNRPGVAPMFLNERYKNVHTFVFTMKQLLELKNKDLDFFDHYCLNGVQAGSRRSDYLLNEHEHF